MIPDINLIPQKEIVEQQKTKAVKSSTILSIILMVLAVGASVYLFVVTGALKSQVSSVDNDISVLRSQIKKLSQIEINGRNLDKKYKVLSELFKNRVRYSQFFEEIQARKPEEVRIDSLDVKPGTVNLSGTGNSYLAISAFINNILNKNFTGGNPRLKDMFNAVNLNSVSYDKGSDVVKFFIVVTFDESKLKQ